MNCFLLRLPAKSFRILGITAVLAASAHTMPGQGYTASVSPTTLTLKTQQSGPVQVTITPVGGASGVADLTCATMPPYASCNWPNLVQTFPFSGSPVTFALTINTSDIDKYDPTGELRGRRSAIAFATLGFPAALFLFFRKRRRGLAVQALLLLAVFCPILALTGCSDTYPQSTPPGTYTIHITNGYVPVASFTLVVTS